jgi:hypothetical protein
MGGTAAAIAKTSLLGAEGARSIFQDIEAGGTAGIPGDAISVELNSLLNGNGLASPSDVARGTLQFAVFGGVSAGLSHALTSLQKPDRSVASNSTKGSGETRATSLASNSDQGQQNQSITGEGTTSSAGKFYLQKVGRDGIAYTKGMDEWEQTQFPVGTTVKAYDNRSYEAALPDGTKLVRSDSIFGSINKVTGGVSPRRQMALKFGKTPQAKFCAREAW